MKRYWITIGIWILIIVISFNGSSLLTNNTSQDSEFADTTTESGKGFNLIDQRFGETRTGVTHIIVFDLDPASGEVLTELKWVNFGYVLALYLNNSFYEIDNLGTGYTQFFAPQELLLALDDISDPIIYAETEAVALSLFSDSQTQSLMQMTSTDYEFAREGDLEFLGEHVVKMREMIKNTTSMYAFGELLGFNSSMLPTETDLNNLNIYVTGEVASEYDNRITSEAVFENSEGYAIIFIIIILFLVFRSPMGVVIPLGALFASLFPAYLMTFILGEKLGLFSVSSFLPSIIAMIGIAVAVDYNLFSMVRYREEFRKHRAIHELAGTWNSETIRQVQIDSSKKMNETAGQAVMYSGFTVIIGFMSFVILGSDFTLGMAFGVSLVVVFSILTARTLTPAILAIFGRFLDWPNVISRASQDVENIKHETKSEKTSVPFWKKWSNQVMKRPIQFLLLGLLILAPFVYLSTQTKLSFDTLNNLPDGTESREGYEVMFNEFNLGVAFPYQVVIDMGSVSVFNDELFSAVNNLASWAISGDQPFVGGSSVTFEINPADGSLNLYDVSESNTRMIENPRFLQQAFGLVNLHSSNNTMIVEFTANLDAGSATAWKLSETLRDKTHEFLDSVIGVEGVYTTGFQALFNDTKNEMYDGVPMMILFAVILIYLALLVLFRSVLIPAKAILTIGGSILFGLGTLVFIFQQGNLNHIEIFGKVLWETEQSSGLMFFIPIFIFTTILGLGMDYSIFIISRIKEEYEKSGDIEDAIGTGLAKTASVITSAAAIMCGTFLTFALSPILILKTFGLALAVSIIIDATIARVLLLPAAMKLAGKWNWYLPKWLAKILPRIDMEH